MTDPNQSGETAPVTLQDLAARLDDLTRELRRQGRAAVAAQAAAESCLEKLSGPDAGDEDEDLDEPESGPRAAVADADHWVRALIPVADALDRMVAQAAAMAERPPQPPARRSPGFLSLFSPARHHAAEPARDPELRALAEGLRVLRAQLATALESCGVGTDRRSGVAVDPLIHRVIEARAPRPGERAGVVLEVIRPGYSLGGRILREAEVVAAKDGEEPLPPRRIP